ncbi:2-oxoglutarate dehydrogenase E1 component [Sandaracinus amylolyticus]|uniref:2-oxoglutarate dehydrogenase E1 component n=1 Tax=Sandaracinus amylolyticus TaxID=927083 RepID=UPI001F00E91F|nr:2-oxoglutarate dehydrogenase E1 component [Sandaracinus amylolyticus]UJR81811.1 Alpha-ketoglutarate decarboxylase [Sandaracinus amylolyticus]
MAHDFGVNQGLVEELYLKYRENPASVAAEWRKFFDTLEEDPFPPRRSSAGTLTAPSSVGTLLTPSAVGTITAPAPTTNGGNGQAAAAVQPVIAARAASDRRSFIPGPETRTATELQSRVSAMVNAYRVRGHLFADLDPLGLAPKPAFDIDLSAFGLDNVDLETTFQAMGQQLSLRQIVSRLKETYCRTIGTEVTQIEDPEERNWLQHRMESTLNHVDLTREQQLRLLGKLTEAEVWETFIDTTYVKTKRFSLEGGESTIPLLELLIETSAAHGADEVVIGMAHRGRLNVLVNVMELPAHDLLAAFEDAQPEKYKGRGDVKYHLGYSSDRKLAGKNVHLTLSFNPSHLEFVNPVVEGRVRAKQDRREDHHRKRVVPLLIHGDAAFIGQGVVAETLNLANLPGYTTGGTIHVVINNQIGYTTEVEDARSTRYCTDLVRMLRCPVFHVNGEDPEAVAQVAKLAAEYRQRYSKDVVVDLYCYRKYGHNEGDEPRFTQPVMYRAVDSKKTVRQVYVDRLLELGKITPNEADAIMQERRERLSKALHQVRETKHTYEPTAFTGVWTAYQGGPDASAPDAPTAVAKSTLVPLLNTLAHVPDGFQLMRQVAAVQQQYKEAAEKGTGIRWGVAENLAYATLLAQGYNVRLTGQDSRRGTFAHRMAVLHDTNSGNEFVPLHHLGDGQGRFEIYDSPLSEQGVLGFEYGYSLDSPDALVIWEAQFGDFANGAQVIIDQFLVSGEDKWHRLNGLVMLLPHGFEGAGPEHSSARLERFLALAAEDNIQVVNLTNASQIFHALRRQVMRPWRKPLVVMSPKSLFRSAEATCTLDDLANGSFQRIIGDAEIAPKKAKRVILCSGKVYYDLAQHRHKLGRDDVAIIRLEQLYPLRPEEIRDVLSGYADGTDLVWVQEEPFNSGAWYFLNARLPSMIEYRLPLRCVSRVESASPATGSGKAHALEQQQLIEEAFANIGAKTARASTRPRASTAS